MITLLVTTDGRRSCISRTIPSALANLHGPITNFVICDDSADPDYSTWLNRVFADFTVIVGHERAGFGGNIRRAWDWLRYEDANPFFFALEDDFLFNRTVDLEAMMCVLNLNPHLAQIVLKRQPWNDAEKRAGGIIEQWPDEYNEKANEGRSWVEHKLFFSTNPYLAKRSLLEHNWPDCERSEERFTTQLLQQPDRRFAFWGRKADSPWVTHFGHERVGHGY